MALGRLSRGSGGGGSSDITTTSSPDPEPEPDPDPVQSTSSGGGGTGSPVGGMQGVGQSPAAGPDTDHNVTVRPGESDEANTITHRMPGVSSGDTGAGGMPNVPTPDVPSAGGGGLGTAVLIGGALLVVTIAVSLLDELGVA